MGIDKVLEQIQSQASNVDPIGASIKFVLDDQCIYLDGKGDSNIISAENKEADCVISTDIDTFQKLQSGDLNPMMAVMTGKIKIKGDMGVAMKLQSLL